MFILKIYEFILALEKDIGNSAKVQLSSYEGCLGITASWEVMGHSIRFRQLFPYDDLYLYSKDNLLIEGPIYLFVEQCKEGYISEMDKIRSRG